jgi:hypothetical protein
MDLGANPILTGPVTTSPVSQSDPELQPDSNASKQVRRELRRPAVGGGFWLVASLAPELDRFVRSLREGPPAP